MHIWYDMQIRIYHASILYVYTNIYICRREHLFCVEILNGSLGLWENKIFWKYWNFTFWYNKIKYKMKHFDY